jgi:hypothetical protein
MKETYLESIAMKSSERSHTLGNSFSLDPLKIHKNDGDCAYIYRVERGLISFIHSITPLAIKVEVIRYMKPFLLINQEFKRM